MSEAVLKISGLKAAYGETRILHGTNLTLESGIVTLIGRNGMGKTTLAKTVMGMLPAQEGTVLFQGEDITHMKSYDIARLGIGYVPQGRRVFPSLTVDEHLTFCAREGKRGNAWTMKRIYELFPRLEERRKLKGTSLSGGEQQMLAIGRALTLNPDLLIMDEPSEGLAPSIIDVLVDFLQVVKSEGMSVLLIEQNLGFAGRVSDTTNAMVSGRIEYSGSFSELIADTKLCNALIGVG
ncbi:MAG: ABC transporter ATP-binding protein [Oscillospiraceae bacterium]